METRNMGFKKTFAYIDFWNNLTMTIYLFFILACLFQAIPTVIASLFVNATRIFTKQDFSMTNEVFQSIIILIIFLPILYFSRKFFYYALVKCNMQDGYNFAINQNGIELFVKEEESVFIDINEIDCINLSMYSAYLKNLVGFRAPGFNNNDVQSNLGKTIITIEVILKNNIDLSKFERNARYYRFFNYKVNKKTNQTKFYLYEIMYDNQYKQDMVVFYEYFGNLIKN